MVEVKYHDLALRLLGLEPIEDVEALQAIERFEAESGRRLPAAVREWYSIQGVERALTERNEACGPESLSALLTAYAAAHACGKHLILFYGPLRANTGYEAYIELDDADDPRMMVDAPESTQTFSQLVLFLAWCERSICSGPGLIVGDLRSDPPRACFGPDQLTFFKKHFAELPREGASAGGHPSDLQAAASALHSFRYFSSRGRADVQTRGNPAEGLRPAMCSLVADSNEALFDLYAFVTPCHGAPVQVFSLEPEVLPELQRGFASRFPYVELLVD